MRNIRSQVAVVLAALAMTLTYFGCVEGGDRRIVSRQFPPAPQTPRVAALGNLPFGRAPSGAEVRLSMFFFGVEPEPAAGLIRPIDLAADANELLICDTGLEALLQRDSQYGAIRPARFAEPPRAPVSIEITPNGDRLVADADAAAVLRYSRDGRLIRRYVLDGAKFRPASALEVGQRVWVTNIAGHTIEMFDRDSGEHLRTLGGRGSAAGRFGIPLGMALTPAGDVCVVDMLNNRVQLLDADGGWLRNIGGPGSRVGEFGRPRDVAVGPDGIIFVADSASQRVHVFSPAGVALLAFGEPGSHESSLELPGGLCITPQVAGIADDALPPGFDAAYYVLVAEQTRRPGVRVYAWGRGRPQGPISVLPGDELITRRRTTVERVNSAGTVNPHWSADGCATCHGDSRAAIAIEQADAACLNCHDGEKALAELHPVGRLAGGDRLMIPPDWPLNNDRLACLTCHEIDRHCIDSPTRPLDNPAMLRGFDDGPTANFCGRCHVSEDKSAINPHRQLDADGEVIEQSCRYCHNVAPPITAGGERLSQANLRVESSQLCLSCHSRHWDFSARGHVERPMPDSLNRPALLPLAGDNVACFTCHNPHQPGLFPSGSVLAARATAPLDAAVALRMNSMELCVACHNK